MRHLSDLSNNADLRRQLSEEIYEIFVAHPEYQTPEFRRLLEPLVWAYEAYQEKPTKEHRQAFLKVQKVMKTYCEQKKFFDLYIDYYEKKLFPPLKPKTILWLEEMTEPKKSTWTWSWPSLNTLGKSLILYLATVGQGAAAAQGLLKSSSLGTKGLAEAKASAPVAATEPVNVGEKEISETVSEQQKLKRPSEDLGFQRRQKELGAHRYSVFVSGLGFLKIPLILGFDSDKATAEELFRQSTLFYNEAKKDHDPIMSSEKLRIAILLGERACEKSSDNPEYHLVMFSIYGDIFYQSSGVEKIFGTTLYYMHAYQLKDLLTQNEINQLPSNMRNAFEKVFDPQRADKNAKLSAGLVYQPEPMKSLPEDENNRAYDNYKDTETLKKWAYAGDGKASFALGLLAKDFNIKVAYFFQSLQQFPENEELHEIMKVMGLQIPPTKNGKRFRRPEDEPGLLEAELTNRAAAGDPRYSFHLHQLYKNTNRNFEDFVRAKYFLWQAMTQATEEEKNELMTGRSPAEYINRMIAKLSGNPESSIPKNYGLGLWILLSIFSVLLIVSKALHFFSSRDKRAIEKEPKREKKKIRPKKVEEEDKVKEAQDQARAEKEAAEAKAQKLLEDVNFNQIKLQRLSDILWKFKSLEEEYSKKLNKVCISLSELRADLKSKSKPNNKAESEEYEKFKRDNNEKTRACEKYQRSLEKILAKYSEFIKLTESNVVEMAPENFIKHVSLLESLKEQLDENHELRQEALRNYESMKEALRKKGGPERKATVQKVDSAKKQKPPAVNSTDAKLNVPVAQLKEVLPPKLPAVAPETHKKLPFSGASPRLFDGQGHRKSEQKPQERFFQRDITEKEKREAEKQKKEAAFRERMGWMLFPVKEHIFGFEVFTNDHHRDYVAHPLVRKYGLLYRLHEFQLLQLVAYHRRLEFESPPLFCIAKVGEFSTLFWNLLMHRYYAVTEADLLSCVVEHYHPDQLMEFDHTISDEVIKSKLFCTLEAAEKKRSPIDLINDLEMAFQDLEKLRGYILVDAAKGEEAYMKGQDQSKIPEYRSACLMILMILGEIYSEIKELKNSRVILNSKLFTPMKAFLIKCEFVRNEERHEAKLGDLKLYAEMKQTVRIDRTDPGRVMSLSADGRDLFKKLEPKTFAELRKRLEKKTEAEAEPNVSFSPGFGFK